jgi:hypothetical protein
MDAVEAIPRRAGRLERNVELATHTQTNEDTKKNMINYKNYWEY